VARRSDRGWVAWRTTRYVPLSALRNDVIDLGAFEGNFYQKPMKHIIGEIIEPNTRVLDLGGEGELLAWLAQTSTSILAASKSPEKKRAKPLRAAFRPSMATSKKPSPTSPIKSSTT
jgi:hypothetical protein